MPSLSQLEQTLPVSHLCHYQLATSAFFCRDKCIHCAGNRVAIFIHIHIVYTCMLLLLVSSSKSGGMWVMTDDKSTCMYMYMYVMYILCLWWSVGAWTGTTPSSQG